MEEWLSAAVPRTLRVRGSTQVAGKRVPVRAFLLVLAMLVLTVVAVIGGADLLLTVRVMGGLTLVGLIVVEGRMWGRSSRAVGAILLRHLRRERRLRLLPCERTLAAEASSTTPRRRPRWQTDDG